MKHRITCLNVDSPVSLNTTEIIWRSFFPILPVCIDICDDGDPDRSISYRTVMWPYDFKISVCGPGVMAIFSASMERCDGLACFECSFFNIFFTRFRCSFVHIFFTRFRCSFFNIFFTRFECGCFLKRSQVKSEENTLVPSDFARSVLSNYAGLTCFESGIF